MRKVSSLAQRTLRFVTLACSLLGLSVLSAPQAIAHPLGNFTTNLATRVVITSREIEVQYVIDMAEIPALSVRQELGAPTGKVPAAKRREWERSQCARSAKLLSITDGGTLIQLAGMNGVLTFPEGQAGLSTLRLECRYLGTRSSLPEQSDQEISPNGLPANTARPFTIVDGNFPERLGWSEISVEGRGVAVSGDVKLRSPTMMLSRYPQGAVSSPLRDKRVSFMVSKLTGSGTLSTAETSDSGGATPGRVGRGNGGLTDRFQSLVAEQNLTVWFALSAMLLALALGSLHALAPGHGKTIMAAYAVSRRGGKRDILAIGATVAITHTIGVALLGLLVSATSVVSPARTLQWASVASGLIVFGVGVAIVRSKFLGIGSFPLAVAGGGLRGRLERPKHDEEHPHEHDAHSSGREHVLSHGHEPDDHSHPHDHNVHSHDHDHDVHSHGHDHDVHSHGHAHDVHSHGHDNHLHRSELAAGTHVLTVARLQVKRWSRQIFQEKVTEVRSDPRFVVSSHSHGGWSHDHVLPVPGALVKRRELIAMGLAGGLVPSPSALVVLLGAIALGRVAFGLALVVAYGVGLALTLIAAGLLLVRFESGVRGITSRMNTRTGKRFATAVQLLPLASGFAIAGAGLLLVLRAAQRL